MTEITNKKEIHIDILSDILLDDNLQANIAINGKIIIKAGYEKALSTIAKLSEHIDYSKYEDDIARIRTQTVDKLVFVDVDKDTKAIVKEIIKKAVETFGAIYMMKGDIDYSAALIDKSDIECYTNPDSCKTRDNLYGFGFQLMSTAFTMAADKRTALILMWNSPNKKETYYITGDGILRTSKDSLYNFN